MVAQGTPGETKGACDTGLAAKEAGVDGLMLMPAMVYKADARETVRLTSELNVLAPLEAVPVRTAPPVDREREAAEDERRRLEGRVPHFAVANEVALTPQSDARPTTRPRDHRQ